MSQRSSIGRAAARRKSYIILDDSDSDVAPASAAAARTSRSSRKSKSKAPRVGGDSDDEYRSDQDEGADGLDDDDDEEEEEEEEDVSAESETETSLETPGDETPPAFKKVKVDPIYISDNEIEDEERGYRHGKEPFVSVPRPRPVAAAPPVMMMKKSRHTMLSSYFKFPSAKANIESEFIVDDDDDDDVATGSKRKRPSPTKASLFKAAASGKGWKPAFRRHRRFKLMEDVPGPEKVLAHAKESETMAKEGKFPPIHNLADIFRDLVDRTPGIEKLAQTLKGRSLRVATMCSGTESPLLALQLISRAIKEKLGVQIKIEHVFSCEIEPFKQAYIERNFAPPILFRDVCELGNDQAHTAYGALVDVPGHVDLLVAGTSCVDYSGLNNKKKGMEDKGESGRTFYGMLNWVKRHKPPLVLLENVKGAPWQGVGEKFAESGYDAAYSNLFDTKNYYIPHTRQRGYLVATLNCEDDLAENWELLSRYLMRPASSPVEQFMLPSDDPRIQHTRIQLARGEGGGKGRSTTDWSRCQGKHERARDEEELGKKRPFTAWEEGGTCKLSHDGWTDWANPQPERVLDLLDISMLRWAVAGVDPNFKSQVWNLSQNVDRNTDSSKPGICPCITPNGIPYFTSRGGPIIGLEALSLQGLPLDELLLTRENSDQLLNLAGNAMSSTVVGACMLAALVVGRKELARLKANDDLNMEDGKGDQAVIRNHIHGDDGLKEQPLDLTTCGKVSMPQLLRKAVASSQYCICEGRALTSSRAVYRCVQCDQTACADCKGRPEHQFELDSRQRIEPDSFEEHVKRALPMCLSVAGLGDQVLAQARKGADVPDPIWRAWSARVVKVLQNAEFRFHNLHRQRCWIAEYDAPFARLEFVLDPIAPQWRITVQPHPKEPVNSTLRALLLRPIARMALDPLSKEMDLIHGKWEICLPTKHTFQARLTCKGPHKPTWEAAMGLGGAFAGKERFSKIDFHVPEDARAHLDADISGTYSLLENCGTANGALHVREGDANQAGHRKIFLFLDADRFKGKDADRFVVSSDTGRLPYPLERTVFAQLADGWKPKPCANANELEATHSVAMTITGKWAKLPSLQMSASGTAPGTVALPPASIPLDLRKVDCSSATAVLMCKVPVRQAEALSKVWPTTKGSWAEIDLVHKSNVTFNALAWVMERIPDVEALQEWTKANPDHNASTTCPRCAPAEPEVQWLVKSANASPIPIENVAQAGPYEQALKNRPAPFVMQLRLDGSPSSVQASVRIGLNAVTLMHRALSRLPTERRYGSIELSWRMAKIDKSLDMFSLPKYTLTSNRGDAEAPTPSAFVLELRPEQRRSLTWMLRQEEEDPKPFYEEEISEAMLPALGWRAEGKATRPVQVRGGVLADAVGYGKTAITLGLIAASPNRNQEPEPHKDESDCFVATKCSLVIVPPHLCRQWASEVTKFTGSKLKVGVVVSKMDLNKLTILEVQRLDMIIMSASLYKSDNYWVNVSRAAGANPLPAKSGRYFESALKKSLGGLRNRTRELQGEGGAKQMYESIKSRKDFDSSHLTTWKSTGRKVGAAYAEMYGNEDAAAEEEEVVEVDGDDEDEEDDEDDDDEGPKKAKGKAKGKGKKVATKPAKAENPDPWGLTSPAVRKDWRHMKGPPLEMFFWNRVVVDEFHYISDRALPGITCLQARAKWVLSGTPPTHDFADIKSIAVFLNIHLGVDDDGETMRRSLQKKRDKERTTAETFHSFREMHSPAWHHRRQQVAQAFLDRFVRQNEAEIDEIPFEEVIKPVILPAAERAIYLELEHQIEALDMRHSRKIFRAPKSSAKNVKKIEMNDRDARLLASLGQSASPEEALLKRCSHFDLDLSAMKGVKASNAIKACEIIVQERMKQKDECDAQLRRDLKTTMTQHYYLQHLGDWIDEKRQPFVDFMKNIFNRYRGDDDSTTDLIAILKAAGCTHEGLMKASARKAMSKEQFNKLKAKKLTERRKTAEAKGGDDDEGGGKSAGSMDALEIRKDEEYRLREMNHNLQRLAGEYVSRVRSLRYFTAIRDLQRAHLKVKGVEVRCPHEKCTKKGKLLDLSDIAVSSTCGHMACVECALREAYIGKCVTPSCAALAKPTSVVQAESLGVEDEETTGPYGIKLAKIVNLVKHKIPKDDRILIMVQFDDLLLKIEEALQRYGVKFLRLQGTAAKQSTLLERFQNGQDRILLVPVMSESASGANLTVANHCIFVSPLLTEEEQEYRAINTQAVGRIRRYGQVKKCHIYRFLTLDTIDTQIYEQRGGLKVELKAADKAEAATAEAGASQQVATEQTVGEKKKKQ